MPKDFNEVVDCMLKADNRYERGAYQFMREALDHTFKSLAKEREMQPNTHISGLELLDGVKDYALSEYGPLAKTVLNAWGVENSEDLGNVVFNLIEHGVFAKSEEDTPEMFKSGLDFEEAFVRPFLPKHAPSSKKPKRKSRGEDN
ncbi:MAG: hypothetical protein Tsb0018_06470 [Opitutales bacterium]